MENAINKKNMTKIFLSAIILFFLALGIRLLYQYESVVYQPVRADAAQYVLGAVNLKNYGIYSVEMPGGYGLAPPPRLTRPPVYSLFLTLFVRGDGLLYNEVLRTQAFLGAMTAVITFVIALHPLRLPWAFTAGLLTALSPHLIALDGYLLSESLFTFIMLFGTLILGVSWKKEKYLLTLIAGFLLALSAHVRAVNLLFWLFLSPLFFFNARERLFSKRPVWIRHLFLLFLGYILITGAHHLFVHLTETQTADISGKGSEKVQQAQMEEPEDHVDLKARMGDIMDLTIITPPDFYVKGESHVYAINQNKNFREVTKEGFWDHPLIYIKWNIWGRPYYLWHWDNAHNGDVYIYPMLLKGFESNLLLKAVHRSMRFVHWPLYLLSLVAPVLLVIRWRNKTLPLEMRMLLIPFLGFIYFLVVLSLTTWLPRHFTPARPFAYILASTSISWLFYYVKGCLPGRRNDQIVKG